MLMTSICLSCYPKVEVEALNQCLENVMGWMRTNKLKPDPDKVEVLLVGSNSAVRSDVRSVLARVTASLKVEFGDTLYFCMS